jgi:cytochrome P450 / NADPH-cytochrome P450 reductase
VIGELFPEPSIIWAVGGKQWNVARKAATPGLSSRSMLDSFVPIILQEASTLASELSSSNPDHRIELSERLSALTWEVLGRCLISARLGLLGGEGDLAGLGSLVLAQPRAIWGAAFSPLPRKLSPAFRRAKRVLGEMRELLLTRVVEPRMRGRPGGRRDVLQVLLDDGLDPKLASGVVMDLFFAGGDTTSAAMTVCLFHLHKDPLLLHAAREEATAARLGARRDRKPLSSADVEGMFPFLMACVKEAMRLHPTGAQLSRKAVVPAVLGGRYRVEQGDTVILSPLFLQRSKKLWGEDALEYRPERFLRGGERGPAEGFLPFGGGLFKCLGNRLAMLEAVLVLATLLSRVELEFESSGEIATAYGPFLRFPKGVKVFSRPRSQPAHFREAVQPK